MRRCCMWLWTLLLFFGVDAFAAQAPFPRSLCEFQLVGPKLGTLTREIFKHEVSGQTFFLGELNPYRLANFQKRLGLGHLIAKKTFLSFSATDSGFTVTSPLSKPKMRVFESPFLENVIHWVGSDFSISELENLNPYRSGERNVLTDLTGHVEFGETRFGIVIKTGGQGTRSFLSMGFNRSQEFQVTAGLDVPCSEVGRYVTAHLAPKYYDPWQITLLKSKQGVFCRIPGAVFFKDFGVLSHSRTAISLPL